MEILYDAMSDDAKRLTVREFLHCYHPDEIDRSKGIYSFVPRSPLLKVIYDTLDSNRDWKSRYFFLEGDSWMCCLGDTDYMPVDTTWGILHPSSMDRSKNLTLFHYVCLKRFNRPSSFAVRRRPQVDIKEFAFLEKIFSKTQSEERTWAKLVSL